MASRSSSPVARAASKQRTAAKKAEVKDAQSTLITYVQGVLSAAKDVAKVSSREVRVAGQLIDGKFFDEAAARITAELKRLMRVTKRTTRAGHLNSAVRHPFVLHPNVVAFFNNAFQDFGDERSFPNVAGGVATTQLLTELLSVYLSSHPETEVLVPNPNYGPGGKSKVQFLKFRKADDLMQQYLGEFFAAAGVNPLQFKNTDRAKLIATMRQPAVGANEVIINQLKATNTLVTLYADSRIDHQQIPGEGDKAWHDRIKRAHIDLLKSFSRADLPAMQAHAIAMGGKAAEAARLVTEEKVDQWLEMEREMYSLSELGLSAREQKRAAPRARVSSRRGVAREVDTASVVAQLQALQAGR